MFSRRINRLLCAALLLTVTARGDEENLWPIYVRRTAGETGAVSTQWLGPLIYTESDPEASYGLRPLFQQAHSGDTAHGNALFPLFTWKRQGEYRRFSFFMLANADTDNENAARPDNHFDFWPIYFSRKAPDPADSYRAVFPLGGTVKNRLGKDRIDFVLFPLYAHTEKDERRVTHAPWPFLRFISGEGHHGFEFWPLFGRNVHDGDYNHQFYLWPLIYKSTDHLAEETPDVRLGVLPFYARDTGPGYIRETWGWPFFGYTHRTAPYRYDEKRYFWPFLVQGRGDDRFVNRWGPFYTHSIVKGMDKTWYLWPVYRTQRWEDDGVAQERNQLLLFVYWSLTQHSLTNPAAAPARKTHLWPLFTAWDNGAGQKQVQVLSPFEVFFPHSEPVRQLWSPLFAFYRYERKPDTSIRHSLLWSAITYRRSPGATEFHLGPLFSVHADAERRRLALGNGIIGLHRPAGTGWRLFLFDFHPKAPTLKATQASSP